MAHSGQPVSLPDTVKTQLVTLLGSDLMGSATVGFSRRELERKLLGPGHSIVRTLEIGGKSGDLPFEVAGGPDYEVTVRVVRTQDAPDPMPSETPTAMVRHHRRRVLVPRQRLTAEGDGAASAWPPGRA